MLLTEPEMFNVCVFFYLYRAVAVGETVGILLLFSHGCFAG